MRVLQSDTMRLLESQGYFSDEDLNKKQQDGNIFQQFLSPRPRISFIDTIINSQACPVTVRVIQSKRNQYFGFDVDSSNQLTLVGQYTHTDLNCMSSEGAINVPTHRQLVVNFIPVTTAKVMETVNDVKVYRKDLNIRWIVSTNNFTHGNNTYEAGTMFNLIQRSFYKKRLSNKEKGLRVRLYPCGTEVCLPRYAEGHFKVCSSPQIRNIRKLSEVIDTEQLPYIISVTSSSCFHDNLCNKYLYVHSMTISEVVIAVQNMGAEKVVHTIPKNFPIEVILDNTLNEKQMLLPDTADIKLIEEKLVKSDIDYALKNHQTCLFEDLGISRSNSVLSLMENERASAILLDTTDDILTQFLQFHTPTKAKLPSEEFFDRTASLQKVGSFWSIKAAESIEDLVLPTEIEPVYESIPINLSLSTLKIPRVSITTLETIDHNANNKNRLSVFSKFTLANKRRLSRLLCLLTGKSSNKEVKNSLPVPYKSTPRNSCPYLDFHQVDVDQECSKILQELTTTYQDNESRPSKSRQQLLRMISQK